MAGAWPKASTESCDWKDSWRTYEAAVLPPIAGLEVAEHLSAQEIAEVAAAQEAIVAFDELFSRSFAGLALETADTILVRSEAASSSQIAVASSRAACGRCAGDRSMISTAPASFGTSTSHGWLASSISRTSQTDRSQTGAVSSASWGCSS